MRAGAATFEIKFTNDLFPLEGFASIHDLPHTRILLLENETRVALVSIELVMLPDALIERCKDMIEKKTATPREAIWIHVTHAITTCHEPGGPQIGLGGRIIEQSEQASRKELEKKELYDSAILESIYNASEAAFASMREACLSVGSGISDLIQNRDIETPQGWWIGKNSKGPSNKEMTVVLAKDLENEPIGCFISYAMKPCTIDNSWMSLGKRQMSSDAPGLACSLIERELGVPALYFMGAGADQVPAEVAWYDEYDKEKKQIITIDKGVEEGLRMVQRIGSKMAEDIKHILDEAMENQTEQPIVISTAGFLWKTKKRVPMKPQTKVRYEADGEAEIPVSLIRMGNLAIVATKPEMNYLTEKQLKEALGMEHVLLITMVNGGMKYLPDLKSYQQFRWEALTSMFMPGAAEQMVQCAKDLSNRIKENC